MADQITNQNFVKFDKEKIYDNSGDNKLLLLLAFLRLNATYTGKVITTLEYIIQQIGYIPNPHKNKINSKIVSLLNNLVKDNYISISGDIFKTKPKEMFEIQINGSNNIFNIENNFVLLTEEEFNCITRSTTHDIGKDILLKVFLVIKSFINNDQISPNIAYPSFKIIKKYCNIKSESCINNAISQLEEIGILFVYHTGSYVDLNGTRQNMVNYYAVDQKELNTSYCKQLAIDWLKNNKGISVDHFDAVTKPNMGNKLSIPDKEPDKTFEPINKGNSDETPEEKKKRIADVWGIDFDNIPESLKLTKKLATQQYTTD